MRTNVLTAVAVAHLFLQAAVAGNDKIMADLQTARDQYAVRLETAQQEFLAAIDVEIAKAAKSGSLESVKLLQAEKAAIDADYDHKTTVLRLRPATFRYQAEVKSARSKLKSSLTAAKEHYTKQLKIAEAEVIDDELKLLTETGQSLPHNLDLFAVGSIWKGRTMHTKGPSAGNGFVVTVLTIVEKTDAGFKAESEWTHFHSKGVDRGTEKMNVHIQGNEFRSENSVGKVSGNQIVYTWSNPPYGGETYLKYAGKRRERPSGPGKSDR